MAINKIRVKLRYTMGFVIAVTAVCLAFWLVATNVTRDGVMVPDKLDSLTASATPVSIAATCLPKDQVSSETMTKIKQITTKDAENCQFSSRAIENHDALWGVALLALAAVLLYLLLVLNQSGWKGDSLQFIAAIVVAFGLAWVLRDRLNDWFTDMNIVGVIFWRGFFAAAVLVAGLTAYNLYFRRVEASKV